MLTDSDQRTIESELSVSNGNVARPGWLSRGSAVVLCRLGRLLIGAGLHLERYGQPSLPPAENTGRTAPERRANFTLTL